MTNDHWKLEFGDNGIEIRTTEGVLATLTYAAKKTGVKNSSLEEAAYLMAAAPELLDAVKVLVAAIESGSSNELKTASGRGNRAIAKALDVDATRP